MRDDVGVAGLAVRRDQQGVAGLGSSSTWVPGTGDPSTLSVVTTRSCGASRNVMATAPFGA
ncbi:MAG TPA: hypothetical protein VEK80_19525 [Kribbellaceae bacterium]|nr:hypothetical protein [Kribbellaceae bacterium]